jgi:tripartite-type tricarboxylate transporter receptor subunit TctC
MGAPRTRHRIVALVRRRLLATAAICKLGYNPKWEARMSKAGSINRRTAIAAIGAAAAMPGAALGQAAYPNKPIKILVGFAPGGPSDIISRVVGAKMGEYLGTQVVIENKTGAGGMIAAETVARSESDGYTLLNTPLGNAVNETLSKTIRVQVGKDVIAVAPHAQTANILVVHPSLGVKTLKDFIAYVKAQKDDVLYATAGRGSATHLNSEFFNMEAGTKMKPVHYKGGGETVKDLLSGQVKIMFSSIAPVQGFVKDGRLIGIATTGPQRDPAFPDLPTVAETIPGFDVRLWIGLMAPAGTPPAVIKRLEDANSFALKAPEIQKALAAQGFAPMPGSAADFDALYRRDRDKWAKVIRASGMDKD